MAAAAAATAPTTAATSATCPRQQAAVLEHLFSADCADCWAAPADGEPASPRSAAAAPAWRFDWIGPGADAAPLAAGALPEATERAQRLGMALPGGQTGQVHRQAASAALAGLRVSVASGPAWQGYFGVQLTLRSSQAKALPTGSSAWVALIEQVGAGSDGTPVTRALVRSVAGPLPLAALAPGKALTHLRALRWPTGTEPSHLQARAWIEGPDGRLLAVAADRCPDR